MVPTFPKPKISIFHFSVPGFFGLDRQDAQILILGGVGGWTYIYIAWIFQEN